MNQGFNEMMFTRGSTAVSFVVPTDRNTLPPGQYMVFLLSSAGVPSVSRIVEVR